MASYSVCAVSGKCFPAIPELFAPTSRCVNCYRKTSDLFAESKSKGEGHDGKDVKGGQSKAHGKNENIHHKTKSKEEGSKEKVGDRKAIKRCTGCWMMTYCDKTCQREHWILVHRYHCDYLSGKKVSDNHNEDSCEDCIAKKTTSKDKLLDIHSPKTGCKFKEESKRMKRELGKRFEFHEDGQNCNCGNEFACEHPFPMGNIQGNVCAAGLDEMMIHAARLSNAFIVKSMKAKENKDTIVQLLDLHKIILDSRVLLWMNVLIYGNVIMSEWIRDMLKHNKSKVEDKIDIENPWWKALKFSIGCIWEMVSYEIGNMEVIDCAITSSKLSEKVQFCQENIKNVASISENKLWHRLKLWPSKMGNSLVLLLPNHVFCISCNADLSGRVVGPVGTWDPSNPLTIAFPSLFAVVASNGGVAATCSPVQNFACGKDFLIKHNARGKFNEEKHEYKALLEKTRKCHLCLKLSSSSHRCIKCLAVQYCSMECAKRDFAFHKTVCSTWAEDPTRRLMSSSDQKDVIKTFVRRMPMWTNETTKKSDEENR